jgi:hypothetical protein
MSDDAPITWHIAMNPIRQPCGCAEWQQFIRGAWVRRTFTCNEHGR